MMRTPILALAAFAVLAAGCSSPGSTPSTISVPPQVPTSQTDAAAAAAPSGDATFDAARSKGDTSGIDAVNALASPVKTYSDESSNSQDSSSQAIASIAITPDKRGDGACKDGVEFFAPDRNNDPNSTETLDFYNASCTQLARDVVRLWTPGSATGSETVNRTARNYALGNSTMPVAVRTSITNYTNATFTKNGFPIVADGFVRETSSNLALGTQKNIVADDESVMQPSTTNVNDYCTDSAGYNSVGIPSLDKSFGWQGGAFTGGTRTKNTDGSVTWTATHTGQTEYGAIGALSISTGATNTACPITTPAYTLTGGTFKGNYTIPVTVTFNHGEVINLTVTGGQLANGDTLNVTTNAGKNPSAQGFINGTVANGTSTVAIFNVNGFGNGRLTIAADGHQFPIVDWNVVR